METQKLAEGGLLAALLVVIGMFMLMTGVAYWLYLGLIAPAIMTLIYLRCGSKVSIISIFCSLCITFFIQGNAVSIVYLCQAGLLGWACGKLLQKKYRLIEDLILASLLGCLFMLGLDRFIAMMTGVSMLDDVSLNGMGLLSEETRQVVYYLLIASMPVASILMIYAGSLVLGHHLHLLNGCQEGKYKQIRYYAYLAPWIYCSKKAVFTSILGMIGSAYLSSHCQSGYMKALFVCMTMIILYYILQDMMKLVVDVVYQLTGRHKRYAIIMQWVLLVALIGHFKMTCVCLLVAGVWIEQRTHIRDIKEKELKHYLKDYPRMVLRKVEVMQEESR